MAYKEVEITDDYINEMAEYFECQGKILRDMEEAYCSILRCVEREGFLRDCSLNYLEEIDLQDRYLY